MDHIIVLAMLGILETAGTVKVYEMSTGLSRLYCWNMYDCQDFELVIVSKDVCSTFKK